VVDTRSLLLIAGNGIYPRLVAEGAREAGVEKITLLAFEGETDPVLASAADQTHWLRVGQLGKFLEAAAQSGASHAIMAGQLAPKNLFDLRPDLKALMILARLPKRNAETLFGTVADELAKVGVELAPATRYMDRHLAPRGHIAGPKPKSRRIEDLKFGFEIAKETSRLDIGQTVVVKNGTVLAVEAFEGTNECLQRGGQLGRGDAVMVKVSKPEQDMRFDVPVIGEITLQTARAAGISCLGVEAGRTLLLDAPAVANKADELKITIHGVSS
jgi:DUF1009 family protein